MKVFLFITSNDDFGSVYFAATGPIFRRLGPPMLLKLGVLGGMVSMNYIKFTIILGSVVQG